MFQYYFKWADGKEARAKTVVRNVIKNLLPNVFYEARLQSIIAYRRHGLNLNISRSEACKMYPPVQDYMRVSYNFFLAIHENTFLYNLAELFCHNLFEKNMK